MCFCGVYILHPTAQCTGTPTHRHLSKHCPEVPAHRHSELGKQPQKVPAHSTQAHIVPSHCVPVHQHITPSSHPKNYKKDTSAHYHNHLRHPMQSTFCYKMFLHLPIKTPAGVQLLHSLIYLRGNCFMASTDINLYSISCYTNDDSIVSFL